MLLFPYQRRGRIDGIINERGDKHLEMEPNSLYPFCSTTGFADIAEELVARIELTMPFLQYERTKTNTVSFVMGPEHAAPSSSKPREGTINRVPVRHNSSYLKDVAVGALVFAKTLLQQVLHNFALNLLSENCEVDNKRRTATILEGDPKTRTV